MLLPVVQKQTKLIIHSLLWSTKIIVPSCSLIFYTFSNPHCYSNPLLIWRIRDLFSENQFTAACNEIGSTYRSTRTCLKQRIAHEYICLLEIIPSPTCVFYFESHPHSTPFYSSPLLLIFQTFSISPHCYHPTLIIQHSRVQDK